MNDTKPSYPSLGQAFGLLVFLFWVSILVGLPVEVLTHLFPEHLRDHALVQSGAMLVATTLILGFTIWRGLRNRRLSDAAAERPALKFTRVPAGILAVACLMPLLIGLIAEPLISLIPVPESFKPLLTELVQPNIFSFVGVVLVAPLLEEILFRGLILDGLLKNTRPSRAIFWSALIFSLAHLNPWQAIPTFLGGLFLGWVYWKTRSVLPCILIHATNNLLGFVLVMHFGPEAGLLDLMSYKAVIALALGSLAALSMGCWWLSKQLGRLPAASPS